METIGVEGIISLHKIPDEWSDEDFQYWWCPVTDKFGRVLRPARISDEAKVQQLAKEPVHNMLSSTGIALFLTNNSVSGQGNMYPFCQILSVGNGTFTGASRSATTVAGDGFTTGSRKAPASNSAVGFQSTVIFNFASGDAVGTWTNAGLYGYKTASSQNATTASGTGALMTIAAYPFVKGSVAYAVQYVLSLSN